MSGWPDLAFDGYLCHSPIKQFPVPFINTTANDSSSSQSVAFQMNTGVSPSTRLLKGQSAEWRYGCQLYKKKNSVIIGI